MAIKQQTHTWNTLRKLLYGQSPLKPTMLLKYLDDTFVFWPNSEDMQIHGSCGINKTFIMEKEAEN